jgi:hypothetical protein
VAHDEQRTSDAVSRDSGEAVRILEELCSNDKCSRQTTHWHPFSVAALLKESEGEYTITVRVRTVKKPRVKRRKRLRKRS